MPWLGLGTHLVKKSTYSVLEYGLAHGIEFIDTAPNYGNGKAHKLISQLLSVENADCRIFTKVGFVSPSMQEKNDVFLKNINLNNVINNNIFDADYTYQQGIKNYNDLGKKQLECIFLHNPELHLNKSTKKDLVARLLSCFESCERLCEENFYNYYGIATWSNFISTFSLSDLHKFAIQVGGDGHKFKYLQTPISLVRLESVVEYLNERRGVLVDGRRLGISIIASSPLHTGELPKIMSRELIHEFSIGDNISDWNAAQTAIMFVKSVPGVSGIFTGCSNINQLQQLYKVINEQSINEDVLCKLVDLLLNS